jgi:GTPase Era involved in 16S rRNA processing
MTEITLNYNPFEAKASYKYEGKNKSIPKCMGTGENSRLQDWLYDFFPDLKTIHNWGDGSECMLYFHGTPGDFEDIQHAGEVFENNNKGIHIHTDHLNKESKSLNTRLTDLRAIFEKMQKESPYTELTDPSLRPGFEQALSSEFEISVIATMSSGKSTLINAILGQEILPARNEATTAKIAQIHDVDGAKGWTVRGMKKNENDEYIPATDEKPATLDEMEKLNSSDNINKIEIKGNIPGINSREMRLLLSDTPGPNNSRTIEHRKHINDLIKADYKPMIMYILNATQLEINDDKSLLEEIAKAMEGSGKQSADRFLFVLNKADELDPDKSEFIEKTISESKNYLEREFGIRGARIFPVSAQLAKAIRMSQAGRNLTDSEEDFLSTKKRRFIQRKERHLSDYVSLSQSCRKKQEEMLQNAIAENDENTQALIYSGLPAIELAMDEYLEKYAITAKISNAISGFNNIIKRLDLKNKTEADLAANEGERKKVASELKALRGHIEGGAEAKKLKEKFDGDIVSIKKKLDDGFIKHIATVRSWQAKEVKNYDVDEEVSLEKARGIISATQKNMHLQYENLSFDLSYLLEKELKNQAQSYLDEYQQYISGLIKTEGFAFSATMNLIKIAIPDNADALLEKFSDTKTVTKKVHHTGGNAGKRWYKPWTWFDDDYYSYYEDVKTEKHIIKMGLLFDKEISPRFEQFLSMIDNAQSIADADAQSLKDFFTKELERLDNALEEAIRKEEDAVKSQESIEQQIEANKSKAEWLKGTSKNSFFGFIFWSVFDPPTQKPL